MPISLCLPLHLHHSAEPFAHILFSLFFSLVYRFYIHIKGGSGWGQFLFRTFIPLGCNWYVENIDFRLLSDSWLVWPFLGKVIFQCQYQSTADWYIYIVFPLELLGFYLGAARSITVYMNDARNNRSCNPSPATLKLFITDKLDFLPS